MKLKKTVALMLAMSIAAMLCGCNLLDANTELVSPPKLTGEMAPIAEALYDAVGTDLNFEYSASGDHRAPIVLSDINGDGKDEAFAFYSTSGDEMKTMHINALCQKGGEWHSVADQTMVANGVEKLEFCDLNGDGTKEIFVGWDINGVSEKQLGVFSFDQQHLVQQLLQTYTSFLCCDLDDDGTTELFVHVLNTAEQTNKSLIYNYGEDGMTQSSGCMMDGAVKSASQPILSTLSNGKTAIYIDEIKGVSSVTEVLYLSNGELVNPLLDNVNTFENISTLRAASLSTKDINGDGTLEIPVASDLPNALLGGEKLYYTNWCTFDGKTLAAKMITVVNTVDGYYLLMPQSTVGRVAVLKNIETHERTFYFYDAEEQTVGDLLFTVTALSASDWDSSDFNRDGYLELARKDSTVFVVYAAAAAKPFGITNQTIQEAFCLIT